MMRSLILFPFLLLAVFLRGQEVFQTRILHENVKTLQVKVNDNPLTLPVITLNGNDVLEISFDEMSHEKRSFSYEIKHCNADWTISSLSSSEYLQEFSRGYIDDYALSVNTTFLYTNYRFILPNNDVSFAVSGNYLINIYEDNQSDNPVAHVCFSVVEPQVEISAAVRGNTDTELNKSMQQLDFDVVMRNYKIQDAQTELKVVVRQNNRTDNQVTGLKPTFYSADKLSFVNNRQLIFEGGNEFHRFDFSSIYNYDERIAQIKFDRPYYQVYLTENSIQADDAYMQDFDVNGRFVVNYQNAIESPDVEADYMFVNFYLPVNRPFIQGNIFLGGNWNYNRLNALSRMDYDPSNGLYYKTLLLKQGGYNYQYLFLREGETRASTKPVDGSHWQTQNEYAIYIYHRPWGGRYDKLVGVKIL